MKLYKIKMRHLWTLKMTLRIQIFTKITKIVSSYLKTPKNNKSTLPLISRELCDSKATSAKYSQKTCENDTFSPQISTKTKFLPKNHAHERSECALSRRAKLPKNAKLAERIGGVATHSLTSKVAKAHHNATHSPCSWAWCAKKLVKVRPSGRFTDS